ncbi:MAG: flavodoxin family protein [candidate division Zixibacteria bacterium]|nr:flavodoxin family protein [candidate division Zixibacteria bacterium]
MKITTILGSPRKKGNTATVLGLFEELAASKHQVERINITDYTVNGCLGCDVCFKTIDEPGCVQKDDAPAIFKRLMATDLIVYATPLYCWSFSAQLKALIDRHYSLVKWKDGKVQNALLEGKYGSLLVTCADPIKNNADLIPIEFERQMKYARCKVVGKYIVPNCTKPRLLGDKGKAMAQEMFDDLNDF